MIDSLDRGIKDGRVKRAIQYKSNSANLVVFTGNNTGHSIRKWRVNAEDNRTSEAFRHRLLTFDFETCAKLVIFERVVGYVLSCEQKCESKEVQHVPPRRGILAHNSRQHIGRRTRPTRLDAQQPFAFAAPRALA